MYIIAFKECMVISISSHDTTFTSGHSPTEYIFVAESSKRTEKIITLLIDEAFVGIEENNVFCHRLI